jgi:phage-related minor tail protein
MADVNGLDEFEDKVTQMEDALGGAEAVASAFNQEMSRLQSTVAQTQREISTLERGISSGLKNAIDGLVFDGDTLADALKGVGKSMVDAAYNAAITPVTNSVGSTLGTGMEAVIQGLLPFENGGSFSQGRVTPFATGGVVSSPTYFPMRGGTGLMGEAGPEAIMPLARDASGKLGVRTQGASQAVNVTMNITSPDAQSFQRSQSQVAAQLSRAMSRGQRNQ